jgi:hypothetical protein
MIKVYEVNTVERVERRYLVEIDTSEGLDEEEYFVQAEERVRCGEIHKFTEGNADIEEVLEVKEQS